MDFAGVEMVTPRGVLQLRRRRVEAEQSRGDGPSVPQTSVAFNPPQFLRRLTRERLWGLASRCHKMPSSRALTTPVNPHRGSLNRLACHRKVVPSGRGTLSTRLAFATGKRGLF